MKGNATTRETNVVVDKEVASVCEEVFAVGEELVPATGEEMLHAVRKEENVAGQDIPIEIVPIVGQGGAVKSPMDWACHGFVPIEERIDDSYALAIVPHNETLAAMTKEWTYSDVATRLEDEERIRMPKTLMMIWLSTLWLGRCAARERAKANILFVIERASLSGEKVVFVAEELVYGIV
uniref:Uncharacterized protein n=1 Tax=Fagus sylvatica TaxID=28930 RepID=A0A2N9GX36_FAGSY